MEIGCHNPPQGSLWRPPSRERAGCQLLGGNNFNQVLEVLTWAQAGDQSIDFWLLASFALTNPINRTSGLLRRLFKSDASSSVLFSFYHMTLSAFAFCPDHSQSCLTCVQVCSGPDSVSGRLGGVIITVLLPQSRLGHVLRSQV